MMDWEGWQTRFEAFIQVQMAHDAAHDLNHVRRVVQCAGRFAAVEGARPEVVYPAAWLHDCVVVPKNSPQRPYASRLAAETAVTFLQQQNYPAEYLEAIAHAIAAHSFTAGIQPLTIEAQVVQDADRMDALGAIGIARCLALGGALARPLYHQPDPFCTVREPDDSLASIDHFYTKLLKLADTMQTAVGRHEAHSRTQFMRDYLNQLKVEVEMG